jgi:MFS family permease
MLMRGSADHHETHRRLRPLRIAAFLQSIGFWVPVEKLFETQIGFDAAAIGFVAAAYAGVVPLLEVPSGVLADRWSRRGVLVVASVALSVSALLGGLSTGVASYLVSTLVLGVFFALYSGTLDALVYDSVLDQTGSGERFEWEIGRMRVVESLGLVTSALAGGWLAELLSTRATYFLTVPFGLLAVVAYLRFTEPGLHRAATPVPAWRQLVLTSRALTGQRRLLPVVLLAVLSALLVQVVLEFGPLWLVALAVPAAVYGPYWAGLTSTFGLGGVLAGTLSLNRPGTARAVAALMALAGVVLALPVGAAAAIAAQVVLALLVVVVGIHVNRLVHDAVPSSVRAGVASGVSTLSWLVFVPFAVVIGLLSTNRGVMTAGWLVAATAVLAGGLLVLHSGRKPSVAVTGLPGTGLHLV